MGRRVAEITIAAEGRDKGKTFILTEMPASRAERWAARVILLMIKSGMDLPDEVAAGGMQAVAAMGLKALGGIDFFELEPLLDEMFQCVQIKEPAIVRAPTEDDIEEVATRLALRQEVWKLHTGFFSTGVLSGQTSATKPAASSATRTSRRP